MGKGVILMCAIFCD